MKRAGFFASYSGSIILAGIAVLLLSGCKPTEKNYQAAYEVAQQKKKAETTDANMLLPAGGLQRIGDPQKKVVGGDTFYYEVLPLKYISGGDKNLSTDKSQSEDASKIKKFCVAVAKYKMNTNCKAQVEDLRKKGYDAFVAQGSGDTYFAIISSFTTLEEAVGFVKEYAGGLQPSVFVGLPGAPVIIERR